MKPDGTVLFKEMISNTSYIITSFYCIIAILLVNVGYLFIRKQPYTINSVTIHQKYSQPTLKAKTLFYSGALFVLISIFPFIKESIAAITLTLNYGYGYRIIEGSKVGATLTSILSGFFLPGAMAMYLSNYKYKKVSVLLLVIYFILYTFQGSRINTFCYLSFFLYLYYAKSTKKVKFSKILSAILVVAILFPLISSTRSISSAYSLSDAVKIALEKIWSNNLFASILYETGNTFAATAGVINYCPSAFDHLNGMSYICSLIYILPNKFTGDFTSKYVFTDEAVSPFLVSYGGVGSSFVAESYYNFGFYLGLLVFVFIGVGWAIISKKTEEAIKNQSIIKTFLLSQIYIAVIFMIRSDLVYRFRALVWNAIPIAIIALFLSKRRR